MEEPLGLEPRTPCLKGRCSNQLSYGSTLIAGGSEGPAITGQVYLISSVIVNARAFCLWYGR